jgi:hypothetical protein
VIFRRLRRRRRSRAEALLAESRAGVERVREALPDLSLADLLSEIAARSGLDLAEIGDRLRDRLGEVLERAEHEASALGDSEGARMARERAASAASRAADLAVRAGAERLLEGRLGRRRSHKKAIFLGAGLVLVAGGFAAYLLSKQTAEHGSPRPPSTEEHEAQDAAGEHDPSDAQPEGGLLEGLRRRLSQAARAARRAQSETERRLWRQYHDEQPQNGQLLRLGDSNLAGLSEPR